MQAKQEKKMQMIHGFCHCKKVGILSFSKRERDFKNVSDRLSCLAWTFLGFQQFTVCDRFYLKTLRNVGRLETFKSNNE